LFRWDVVDVGFPTCFNITNTQAFPRIVFLIQMPMLSFTGPLTKVLVTNGNTEGSKKLEIIDLEDPTNVCQPSFLADYPFDVQGASGGLLTNNNALICGGLVHFESHDDCFAINDNGIINGPRLVLITGKSFTGNYP
jgi:hypothetical protein